MGHDGWASLQIGKASNPFSGSLLEQGNVILFSAGNNLCLFDTTYPFAKDNPDCHPDEAAACFQVPHQGGLSYAAQSPEARQRCFYIACASYGYFRNDCMHSGSNNK